MKIKLLALLALLFTAPAFADKVDLYPAGGYGALHQYREVANSSGVPVNIIVGPGNMQVWFDDQIIPGTYSFSSYWVGTYAGNGLVSTLQKCVFPVGVSTCQLNGELIFVTPIESSSTRCVRQGRGQRCFQVWHLDGGTILRDDPVVPVV